MKIIEKFLKESGYGQFISSEDMFPIPADKVHNKTSEELYESVSFFFLVEGFLDVFYPDKNGKNHLLARVYPEDYQLGGIPKYFNVKYHSLNTYIASFSKNCLLYGIKKEKVEELFKTPKFLEFTFEKNFLYTSTIIRENYFRSIFTLEEYLAYILYTHSKEDSYTVVSYSQFAGLLKCDRTNLYRALSSLEDQGLVEKDGKTIRILSMEMLEEVFDEKL